MDSVKVALRIRPLVPSEIDIGCRACIERIPNEPQVMIGKAGQLFTFNYVFDEFEGQGKVYHQAVKLMIDHLFKGYNVTILAYGQTGSGKTFTMGTNYCGEEELGIIPRAVYDIFDRICADTEKECRVTVSFIELYNESLYDLLTKKPREQSIVEMREISNEVCIPGLTELEVNSPAETLEMLKEGSAGRIVGATAMNSQSSRSHAIFTINFRIVDKDNSGSIVNSKFHLVDLAGSERSKKTGATGDRFREGVNINKGLLILGNVISQLCEGNIGYINYRDSKLTRLLQDSLGGNSITLMIACVSPADYNQDETLSTLRYADRARKIKNKPVVNQDPRLAEIHRLRKENADLRLQMKRGGLSHCPPEHDVLQAELANAMGKINELSKALGTALCQNTNIFEKTMSIENVESALKEKLKELMILQTKIIPENDPQWGDLKIKIAEVQEEQKKLEREIFYLDKDDLKQDEELHDDTITKQRQDHILFQVKINNQIRDISTNLKWKEELMTRLAENSGQLCRMQGVSEESMEELKKQLSELQQEKEELLNKMENSSHHAQNASAKVAENRRKRLQELEHKVTLLNKKVCEQERIIKMKEKSDEKILKLKQEITNMKQLKVKLIQQMKSETDKFKIFKALKDREVCQLKSQNMKNQNELKRMEQMHIKQQNVLKRKLEAAAAANKRIMAALERQKIAKDKRTKGSTSEKIKEKLIEDLELLESECHAQKSLDYLLQDRAALTKELSLIKKSLIDESISDEEKIKLKTNAKQVEDALELRSAEISDLQQKLIDIHQDDYVKNNWEVLQSMADAKFALSHLFNIASEKIKDNINKSALLMELMEQQSESDQQLEEYKKKMSELELAHLKDLERMEKECEDKVNVFMKLVAKNIETQDGSLSETFRIQAKELEKLEEFRRRIENLEKEKTELIENNQQHSGISEIIFRRILKRKKSNIDKRNKVIPGTLDETFTTSNDKDPVDALKMDNANVTNEYDPHNDPDWDLDTPIHRRFHALKQRLMKRHSCDMKCTCAETCEPGSNHVKSFFPCSDSCLCDGNPGISSSKRIKSFSKVIDFKLSPANSNG